ncbi:hypothetical protein DRN69_07065 [Candidatus Pacearchaeota archaeon]|nr:MAG: hypothetical protein DRN69_07065 [Candidatus Pacearchaeota archaeon]
MSKNSFEQPIKREEPPIEEMEKKLDKAEKMVEEVEGRWKDEIEEFEIEKSVKELKKLWEENEAGLELKDSITVFPLFSSLPLPEIPPFLLERTSNKFLREFDWKKFKGRKYLNTDLGLFLSAFLNKNIERYILSQKRKEFKEGQIKPIEVHLNVKELPVVLKYLGYRNPKKLYLIIKGDVGGWTGNKMKGGEIIVKGNCNDSTGFGIQGGEITIKGNCADYTGLGMQGGKIIVKGNCRYDTGRYMQGGELNIKGEVESFDKSAFSSNNQGTIIWKNTKIWENGNWTKEGKEMWERREIP